MKTFTLLHSLAIFSVVSLSACTTKRAATPPHVDASRVVSSRAVGAAELTAEDLAGIFRLRYTKVALPSSPNGRGWDMKIVLERAGMPAQTLYTYGLGDKMPPFLLAFDWSKPAEADAILYLAHSWTVTNQVKIPQPANLVPNMRSFASTIKEGRTVIALWTSTGLGWNPGDTNFVQRIVFELKSRPNP